MKNVRAKSKPEREVIQCKKGQATIVEDSYDSY
jgi:hypothetical protein